MSNLSGAAATLGPKELPPPLADEPQKEPEPRLVREGFGRLSSQRVHEPPLSVGCRLPVEVCRHIEQAARRALFKRRRAADRIKLAVAAMPAPVITARHPGSGHVCPNDDLRCV